MSTSRNGREEELIRKLEKEQREGRERKGRRIVKNRDPNDERSFTGRRKHPVLKTKEKAGKVRTKKLPLDMQPGVTSESNFNGAAGAGLRNH